MSWGEHINNYIQKQEEADECDELFTAVQSTEPQAKATIERLRSKQGFRNHPDGFRIHPHELNRDGWTEGFMFIPDGE